MLRESASRFKHVSGLSRRRDTLQTWYLRHGAQAVRGDCHLRSPAHGRTAPRTAIDEPLAAVSFSSDTF